VGAGGARNERDGDGGEGDEDGAKHDDLRISEPVVWVGAAGHSVGPPGFTEVKGGFRRSSKTIFQDPEVQGTPGSSGSVNPPAARRSAPSSPAGARTGPTARRGPAAR